MSPASRDVVRTLALALPLTLAACGSSAPPPIPPVAVIPVPPAETPPAPPAAPAATPAPAASATPAASYVDPDESANAIRMTPLFAAGAPAKTFHAAKLGDAGCLHHVKTLGDAVKDYAIVTGACGPVTGLAEYVKPLKGKLDATMDRTDTYVVALAAGYCYRIFGTSDQTIFDLGISTHPTTGGTTLTDGEKGSVALVEKDKAFCVDTAGDWIVDIDAESQSGTGGYMVGLWARPKK